MSKLIEYLKTIFKVKRNFAESVNATGHAEKYRRILLDIEEAELMLAEGEEEQAKAKISEIRRVETLQ